MYITITRKHWINTALITLVLCSILTACSSSGEQRLSFGESVTELDALKNVAREFSIKELNHVASFPLQFIGGDQVIGMITQRQKIESLDEAAIRSIVRPAVQRHVDKHMSAYHNFRMNNPRFMLSSNGGMVLAVSISSGNLPSQQVYVKVVMSGGKNIIVRGGKPTISCANNSCSGHCSMNCKGQNYWCTCSTAKGDTKEEKIKGCQVLLEYP